MTRIEKIAFFSLATLVWIYLGLRSVYIPLIHDETVTYFAYIQSATFIPPWSYWDANNHFLNSAIGALTHLLFGHSPFITRLGSWVSFLPLVFFVYQLSHLFKSKLSQWAFIIPLLTTPFFIEFFSLTRGYGMAMSWFLGTIFYAIQFTESSSPRSYFKLSIVGILTSLSSLSVISSVFIVYGWILLFQIYQHKKLVWTSITKWFGYLILPQLPLVYYVFQLKERGLLYYGGDELIKYSLQPFARFFFNNSTLWWIVAIVFSLVITIQFVQFVKGGIARVFQPIRIFSFVLILAVAAIFLQHFLLGVNYPEDRAALYLFPLLIGSWISVPFKKYFKLIWFLPLIYFPSDLLTSANIEYSKLWPHEHVPNRFWEKTNALKTDFPVTLSTYFLRHGIWNYQSLDKGYSSNPNIAEYPSKWADVLMVDSIRIKKVDLSLYKKLDYDYISGQTLLKRSPKLVEIVVTDTTINELVVQHMYSNIWEFNSQSWAGDAMALYFEFQLETTAPIIHLNLITSVFDSAGNEVYHADYDLGKASEHWNTQGVWRIKQFLPPLPKNSGRFVTYIYNPKGEKHMLRNTKVSLAKISEPIK